MEGACVFIDKNNISNLFMYKEIINKTVFCLIYNKIKIQYGYISIYQCSKIIPDDSIHILYKLPFFININNTIDLWKNMAINKLINLNRIIDCENYFF